MAINSEFGLIEHIKQLFGSIPHKNIEGIGDDCAIIPIGGDESLVVTTDLLAEGVHFLCDGISPESLGEKSLAVNLSDVAAMGATPICSMLSLALPKDKKDDWAQRFISGYNALSLRHDVALIGGDTSSSLGAVMINVVAFGRVKNQNIKRRSSAKVGDGIYVVGKLGASGAGLKDILNGDYHTPMAKLHNSPRAQVPEGIHLGGCSSVNAMIDLSDGLASDLRHILKLSGVDAVVDTDAVPSDFSLEMAISSGEDYKLLFTASDDSFKTNYQGETIYKIGEIVPRKGHQARIAWLSRGAELDIKPSGFTHF